MTPDSWQEELLHSAAPRVLLNCSRQSGKSTISAVLALHRALYHPGSLVLVIAPALRQSQELFGKVASFYRSLGRPIPAQAERKLYLELENGSRIVTLTLKKELLNFRQKIDPSTAHDSYSHWREGEHDDLVLATAMGCWYRQWWNSKIDTSFVHREARGAGTW